MESTEKKAIWLIGEIKSNMPEGFPTNRDVLRLYLYHRLVSLKQKMPSITCVTKELIAHCKMLEGATVAEQVVVRKIKKAINNYDSYKKSMHRETNTQKNNEQLFINFLNDRFDITQKSNNPQNRKQKAKSVPSVQIHSNFEQTLVNNPVVIDSTDSWSTTNVDWSTTNDTDFETTLSNYHKSNLPIASVVQVPKETSVIDKIINCPDVHSALDRTFYSTPKFTILCAAIAGAVGEDVNECVLSESTINRRRKVHRDQIVKIIKNEFLSTVKAPLVLHWDGKRLKDATSNDMALRNVKVRVPRIS